jgi:DNA-binding NarL/FixJ family response regulator
MPRVNRPMRSMNTTAIPTVVLADDNLAILEHISRILTPNYSILAAVPNGQLAVAAVVKFRPDVAVLDIAMPELDGFEAARQIRQNSTSTQIVFLTMYDDRDYVSAALQAGVLGYVLKSLMLSDLIPAIENALAGHVFVSSRQPTANP